MKFIVHMRDGSTFLVEALYIEVISSVESSYTFLGRVPGYPRAIMASFPVDLVSAVLPASGSVASRVTASSNDARPDRHREKV